MTMRPNLPREDLESLIKILTQDVDRLLEDSELASKLTKKKIGESMVDSVERICAELEEYKITHSTGREWLEQIKQLQIALARANEALNCECDDYVDRNMEIRTENIKLLKATGWGGL